ncbi:hypothetical protein K504DRAFT_77628 [Pleomassaria siparia CBS 279.74]|uniref:Uncharacterized protein n=1 Tax=Pleomassaria siparia CBS 279.74 TaxID=1314801 RepID=A0A6G1K1G4_9PLEO|nr:hypothetical protein K504DRAFT_77628 [Pleomassaria siparia CBS 279.74]
MVTVLVISIVIAIAIVFVMVKLDPKMATYSLYMHPCTNTLASPCHYRWMGGLVISFGLQMHGCSCN